MCHVTLRFQVSPPIVLALAARMLEVWRSALLATNHPKHGELALALKTRVCPAFVCVHGTDSP